MVFVKGKSGNPGGRPKVAGDVVALARKHSLRAIERLAEIMESDDSPSATRAAIAIMERAYGKPAQPIEGTLQHGVTDDLAKLMQRIRSSRGA